MRVFLLAAALFVLTKSECPDVEDLPFYYGSKYYCARVYMGWGSTTPLGGCNGCSIGEYNSFGDGDTLDAGEGQLYPFGSVVVRPGCTLYTFHHGDEYAEVYEGPLVQQYITEGHDTTRT